eukprot:ANDGO_03536.mRNA.1 Niemann-Pick C1 protein homolog 2
MAVRCVVSSRFAAFVVAVSLLLVPECSAYCVYQGGYDRFGNPAAVVTNGSLFDPAPNLPLICPRFASAEKVCCNEAALQSLQQGKAAFSAFFSACPACVANLQSVWCAFACRPDHELYMKILKLDPTDPNRVANVGFNISMLFLDGVYTSCQDVTVEGGSKFPDMYGHNAREFFDIMLSLSHQFGGVFDEMIAYYTNSTDVTTVYETTDLCQDTCPASVCRAKDSGPKESPLKDLLVLDKYDPVDFGISMAGGFFGLVAVSLLIVGFLKFKHGEFHKPCDEALLSAKND